MESFVFSSTLALLAQVQAKILTWTQTNYESMMPFQYSPQNFNQWTFLCFHTVCSHKNVPLEEVF